MKHTLTQQIDALQEVNSLLRGFHRKGLIGTTIEGDMHTSNIRSAINDAASTIASLNLIKSLNEDAQLEFLRQIKNL